MSATVIDDDGVTHTPDVQPVSAGPGTYRIPLAPGTRLLSITFQADTSLDLPFHFPIAITSADIDGAPLPLDGWVPLTWRGSGGQLAPAADGFRFDVQIGAGRVFAGLIPRAGGDARAPVDDGGRSGRRYVHRDAGRAADRAPPGGRGHASSRAPSPTRRSSWCRPAPCSSASWPCPNPASRSTRSGRWARRTRSPRSARMASSPGARSSRRSRSRRRWRSCPQSLAVGMNFTAAAGGVGLVIIGVSASLYFAQRRRDYEFAALRAMGAERSPDPADVGARAGAAARVRDRGRARARIPAPAPGDAVRRARASACRTRHRCS